MLFRHQRREPLYNVRCGICKVVLLTWVCCKIVKLNLKFALVDVLANGFPVTRANALLTSVAWKFAIEKLSFRLSSHPELR